MSGSGGGSGGGGGGQDDRVGEPSNLSAHAPSLAGHNVESDGRDGVAVVDNGCMDYVLTMPINPIEEDLFSVKPFEPLNDSAWAAGTGFGEHAPAGSNFSSGRHVASESDGVLSKKLSLLFSNRMQSAAVAPSMVDSPVEV